MRREFFVLARTLIGVKLLIRRLAEDYFFLLLKSIAHRAFPPILDIIAQNIPYRVHTTKLFVVPYHR